MQQALGWSSLTAGLLAATNAVGYLAGALVADRLLARWGERSAIVRSLIALILALSACALTTSVFALMALRMAAGMSAAVAYIGGAAIVARLASGSDQRRAGRFLGLYFSGPGLGIAASALAITPLATAETWRESWLALGLLCLICLGVVTTALRRVSTAPRSAHSERLFRRWRILWVAPVVLSYTVFGAGYSAYATFSVAYIRVEGYSVSEVTWFWFTIGSAGIILGLATGAVLQRARGGLGLAVGVGATALASALLLFSDALVVAILSAAIFGVYFSITTAAATAVRHELSREEWTPAIAGLLRRIWPGSISRAGD